jgi:hypothetical protein
MSMLRNPKNTPPQKKHYPRMQAVLEAEGPVKVSGHLPLPALPSHLFASVSFCCWEEQKSLSSPVLVPLSPKSSRVYLCWFSLHLALVFFFFLSSPAFCLQVSWPLDTFG